MNIRFRIALSALLTAVCFGGIVAYPMVTVRNEQSPEVNASPASYDPNQPIIRVMSIGGSIAHGWKDTDGPGFLKRAFDALSENTDVNYEYFDQTIVGANSTQLATIYKGKYQQWLRSIQPHVVVISWGLMNDAKNKVPLSDFRDKLADEIDDARAKGASVLVVTPPITKGTYTEFQGTEDEYVHSELEVADSYNSPYVAAIDIYNEMKEYLSEHNETYEKYEGDGWHPNTLGHQLAGKMLYEDILQKVRNGEVQ